MLRSCEPVVLCLVVDRQRVHADPDPTFHFWCQSRSGSFYVGGKLFILLYSKQCQFTFVLSFSTASYVSQFSIFGQYLEFFFEKSTVPFGIVQLCIWLKRKRIRIRQNDADPTDLDPRNLTLSIDIFTSFLFRLRLFTSICWRCV